MVITRNNVTGDNINEIRLKVLDFGYAKSSTEWVGSVVSPMYSRLYYIVSGDPYIIRNGEKIPLQVGKCYLLPTGYSFKHACETHMEQYFFHININDSNSTDLLRCVTDLMEYTPEEDVIPRVAAYVQSSHPVDSLRLKKEIYSAVLTLVDKYGIQLKQAHYSRCVLLAMEYIKDHLNLKLSASVLAAYSHVSESTLSKKFKSELGVTVGSYIDDCILFEAERLLLKSDLTVLQISERFGFCDQFYFSRKFKQKYGEAPQKYRKLRII